MTTDTAPLTAEDFARGIINMRFSDVMKVVDAINTANGRGFLPLSAAEIVRRTVAEVKRLGYWRAFDERSGLG